MAYYFHIDDPSGETRFDEFLRRLKVLGIAAFHPTLLAVMSRAGSDRVDLDAVANLLSPPPPNLSWQYKRRQLERSMLQLNRRLWQASGQWTDASIVRRAEELFEKARVIWPEC